MMPDQASVLVRYAPQRDEIEKWLAILATQGPQRWLMRKLQRTPSASRNARLTRCWHKAISRCSRAGAVCAGRC